MLSDENEPFNEQGCWVWTCSWPVLGWVLELELPLEWAEPSDRTELLAGELDELAALSPWHKNFKRNVWVRMNHCVNHTLLQFSEPDAIPVFSTSDWKALPHTQISTITTYHPTIPTHIPFLSVEVLRLFLSCCTMGFRSFPAFSLCLLALRLRPLGGAAWSRPTLGGSVLPSSLYRRSISFLWNACSSEISFMCLVRRYGKRSHRNEFKALAVIIIFFKVFCLVIYSPCSPLKPVIRTCSPDT